jgi:hypothetical protein
MLSVRILCRGRLALRFLMLMRLLQMRCVILMLAIFVSDWIMWMHLLPWLHDCVRGVRLMRLL